MLYWPAPSPLVTQALPEERMRFDVVARCNRRVRHLALGLPLLSNATPESLRRSGTLRNLMTCSLERSKPGPVSRSSSEILSAFFFARR